MVIDDDQVVLDTSHVLSRRCDALGVQLAPGVESPQQLEIYCCSSDDKLPYWSHRKRIGAVKFGSSDLGCFILISHRVADQDKT